MANRFEKYTQPETSANRFAKYKAATHSGPAQHESASDQSYMQVPESDPFTESFGGHMVRGARGLGNLLFRAGNYQPDSGGREDVPFIGDKAIQAQDEMDKPLNDQPGAGIGGFLGEMAVTPGLGATKVASKAPGILTKALGARAGVRALEGAVNAAQYADPTEATSAATTGGVLGMALGRVGDVAGRLGSGLVKKSDAAKHLEHVAGQHGEDMHIPLSLAADTKDPVSAAVAGTYRNVAPMIPFVGGRLEGQREKAREQVRNMALREASPEGLHLSATDLSDTDRALSKISQEFIDQYDNTVKSYAFNVPQDLSKQLVSRIRAGRPNVDATTLGGTTAKMQDIFDRFSDKSGQITGDNLLFAKREISELIGQGKTHEKDAYKAGIKWIDDHIVSELSQGNSKTNVADLQKYLQLAEPWKAKVATEKAAKRALNGQFGPEDLYRTSKPGSETRAIGSAGSEVLQPNATRQSLEGKILGGALLGGVGTYMGVVPALGLATGGHLLANKSTQRLLTGDTKAQKATIEFLRNYPQTKNLPSYLRRATTAELGDEYDAGP